MARRRWGRPFWEVRGRGGAWECVAHPRALIGRGGGAGRRGVLGTMAGTATAREAADGRKGTTLTGGARRSAAVREGEGEKVGRGGRWARLGRGEKGKKERREREEKWAARDG
jgi:hypothetical protein